MHAGSSRPRRPVRTAAAAACALATILAAVVCAAPPAFDSSRAFEHVRQLVAIGPRPPGSPGAEATRKYLRRQLESYGVAVAEQAFDADTPLGRTRMVNVRATIPGRSAERILFGGHYDTKLFREFRFVGANDGGSSTAMLLELARVLKGRSNPLTIELVFFDGEEALVDWRGTDHTYGSRHYVQEARRDGSLASIRALILLDMVGDRHLNILRESRSTPWLTDLLWESARKLGYGAHFLEASMAIEDDHVPFLDAGVPAVDVIDLDYGPWHTAGDTLDAVSARSLQIVGDVVLDALPRVEARLSRR